MDNFFINRQLAGGVTISIINFISKVPRLLKAGYHIHPLPAPVSDMITIEQRIKYYNLLYATIGNHVRGDVVELGYFTGECAILFQKVIEMNSSQKGLHLYDSCQSI